MVYWKLQAIRRGRKPGWSINTPTIGADIRDNASYFNGLIDDIRVAICVPNLFSYRSHHLLTTTQRAHGLCRFA